jgi:hypothetical protein
MLDLKIKKPPGVAFFCGVIRFCFKEEKLLKLKGFVNTGFYLSVPIQLSFN